MSDEDLVKAAQRGNDDAFYKLILNNKDKLYVVAYSYLKNEQDALEAIQEVTCRAYTKINMLKEPNYFSTWITRIAMNYCIDELKKRKKIIFIEKEECYVDSNINEDNLILEEAIDKLKPEYRKVITLKYFQDMTTANIAKVMECPEGTVKTWISRALKELRSSIKHGGGLNV